MISGLHIEPTNICTLKCPGCARTRFLDQWPQHWKNHSLDVDQLLKFLDIDLSNLDIVLCGNYGDPIYHPDLIDFVTKLSSDTHTLTNCVIELFVINKIQHIPIVVYNDDNEIVYIFDNGLIYNKNINKPTQTMTNKYGQDKKNEKINIRFSFISGSTVPDEIEVIYYKSN